MSVNNNKKSEFSSFSGFSKKNSTNKKIVVKKRTADLTPTKASAAAITLQAQRARKQSLNAQKIAVTKIGNYSDFSDIKKHEKIPLWVWIFFGCSLLLFCVSFYKAIISPSFDSNESTENMNQSYFFTDGNSGLVSNSDEINQTIFDMGIQVNNSELEILNVELSSSELVIENFFNRLSQKDYDRAFELLNGPLKNTAEMKDHFTAFRMNPFLDGIEGNKISPNNITYISTSQSGNKTYQFDLSYVLKDSKENFEEKWEVVMKNVSGEDKIATMKCITHRCSFHPLFWPEKFGMMK